MQTAKRAAEERLRRGRMSYTILQPTFFTEVWLSPTLGFDPTNATARIYGSGQNKISWICVQDVAKFAVAAAGNPQANNSVVKLGGPDALSPLEVVRLAEAVTRRKFVVEHVPEDALKTQFDAASDSLQQSFAGLMLYYARGDAIDMTKTLLRFPVHPLRSVREHLAAIT
ncbi:MAG TPA: NmrA family NAD(P)-binding protein [Casimicrobiaceae bacterium]|nr:NmrA family NAD(P)-binding protein [Casimicrobiaceae bacterium]